LVGDYTNPILQALAAQQVKKAGELSEGGRIIPDLQSMRALIRRPYFFTIQLGCRCVPGKDQIVCCIRRDDKSVACAGMPAIPRKSSVGGWAFRRPL